jgi:hypothetical protein
MEQKNGVPDWILQEYEKQLAADFTEKLPVLKFEERKITEFKVDFSSKFEEYPDKFKEGGVRVKIPVEHLGHKKVLWLNKRNPLLRDIIKKAAEGKTDFKVIQTGTKKDTKYSILED